MTKLERIIITWPPIAFLIRKSKKLVLPGFQGLPFYDVVIFFFKQINRVGLNERAAAISFNFIMAIPAAMIFIFTLVPYLPVATEFKAQLLKLIKDLTPNKATSQLIIGFIDDFFKPRNGLLSFVFLITLFYASNAMIGIVRTFDRSIQETKGYFLHQRLRALRLTTLLILLLIASVLMLIGQEELAGILKNIFHMRRRARIPWWNGVRYTVILAFLFYGIALIYRYGPSVHKKWPLVSPGAILSTFLILATTVIFSFWVNNFASYNKVYGSIGTVLIVMLLIYFNSLILLIGFELNVSLTYLKQQVQDRKAQENQPTTNP